MMTIQQKYEAREFQTVIEVSGPLMFVDLREMGGVSYGEMVEITTTTGERRRGQVLDVSKTLAIIQCFEGTSGLETKDTSCRFLGETMKIGVSPEMLGRVFNGMCEPIDDGPELFTGVLRDINSAPINPTVREFPRESI